MFGKLQKIIDISICFLIAAGVFLLLGKNSWWPSYYSPHYFGVFFFVSSFLIILAKLVLSTKDEKRNQAAIIFQTSIVSALVLNALGELYLYQLYRYGFQYDKVLHFANALIFVISVEILGEYWYGLKFRYSLPLAVFFVIAFSFIWEISEYTVDLTFKTSEFGIYGQYKFLDTFFDLAMDFAGMTLGVFALAFSDVRSRWLKQSVKP